MHLALASARVEEWLKRVLPTGKLVPVPASDPLFDSFFQIDPQEVPGFGGGHGVGGTLYEVYRDNNRTKGLLTIVAYRGILGHHWRWEDGTGSGLGDGESPGGKAYRLGLNILVYGLSH